MGGFIHKKKAFIMGVVDYFCVEIIYFHPFGISCSTTVKPKVHYYISLNKYWKFYLFNFGELFDIVVGIVGIVQVILKLYRLKA